MMNSYSELRAKQQEEFNSFPLMFAFSRKQFDEGMRKLGLEPSDVDKIYSIDGGGYIRRTDYDAFIKMLKKHGEEMEKAIAEDTTGEGFIFDMFCYELQAHEYSYTYDISDTLDCLDLTIEKVNEDKRLLHGLKLAMERCG